MDGDELHSGDRRILRIVAALALFGSAFGFIEAAVVADLRAVYEPIHERLHPGRGGDLFPLIRLDQLSALGETPMRLLHIELVREFATIVLLAAAALGMARSPREWFAAFAVAFGVWDLFYYAFLKLLLDWPASIWTWDLLFLLPVPWVGPVIAPVIVSITMIASGVTVIVREEQGRPVRPTWAESGAIAIGAVLLIGAFCRDATNVLAGATPEPFAWWLFAAGELVGLAGICEAIRRRR